MDTRRSYDRVADRYAAEIGGELAAKPLDRALLDVLAELAAGGVIADVGAGPGHVAAYLAGRGARVVGTDLSPAMCRHATVPAFAADMTALPLREGTVAAIVCAYAVIHLDGAQRDAAYREFARVLRPGGHVLVTFHVSDPDAETGGSRRLTTWWDTEVNLEFRFLDPPAEAERLAAAGLAVVARLDREPHQGTEHPSRRGYLLATRLTGAPGAEPRG